MTTKALTMAAAITANVDAFYAKRITFAEFNAESIRLYDIIEAAGLSRSVSSIQRNAEKAS